MSCMKRIVDIMGDLCTTSIIPTRRSNIPCHSKFDIEAIGEIFLPYKKRGEIRKAAGDRKVYNDVVWKNVLKVWLVKKKVRCSGFEFHHEITTDGVSVTLLYSR